MGSDISDKLGRHYTAAFREYGATPEGVDWGSSRDNLQIRYRNMLAVMKNSAAKKHSLLDVGCGYAGLFAYACEHNIQLDYTGLDISEDMINWAIEHYAKSAQFIHDDIYNLDINNKYDYVICNGILTQKLDVSESDMDAYSKDMIKIMFSIARTGVAFNMMTTHVNYFADNLFYKNPVEMFSWCVSELSPYVKIDHSYPLYEYTMYVYKEPL